MIVSRGGRPDLAGEALPRVAAPTLLIVGGDDVPVIGMNREALERLRAEKELKIVPGATARAWKEPLVPPQALHAFQLIYDLVRVIKLDGGRQQT